MWRWVCIGILLGTVSFAGAQTAPLAQTTQVAPPTVVLQPQSTPTSLPTIPIPQFRLYRCSCTPSSAGVTSTPSPFGGTALSMGWSGVVYATSTNGAVSKAQRACSAASRGSLYNCLSCQCQ